MKLEASVIVAVAMFAFAVGRAGYLTGAGPAAAAQAGPEGPPPAVLTPEMQAIIEFATPSEDHRVLDRFIGEWSGAFTIRMAPDAEPAVSRGTVKREWVLGGRFVKEVVEAQGDTGVFEGVGYIGYDNFDGQYEIVWMDNQGTDISIEAGTYHPDPMVMHMRGSHRDPASGRLINAWSKIELSDPDRHVLTGYATDEKGHTFKAVEGVLERQR